MNPTRKCSERHARVVLDLRHAVRRYFAGGLCRIKSVTPHLSAVSKPAAVLPSAAAEHLKTHGLHLRLGRRDVFHNEAQMEHPFALLLDEVLVDAAAFSGLYDLKLHRPDHGAFDGGVEEAFLIRHVKLRVFPHWRVIDERADPGRLQKAHGGVEVPDHER
jgi:hypothetical protein